MWLAVLAFCHCLAAIGLVRLGDSVLTLDSLAGASPVESEISMYIPLRDPSG